MDHTGITAYTYEDNFIITDEMKSVFDKDGAFIIKNLLDKQEISLILQALEGSPILQNAWEVSDDDGGAARMLLWTQPGNDVTGMVARCDKVVNVCEKVLGDEVYHYSTKLMMKEARFGGKHLWHQDFGYWYSNGCLKPDMLTVFIPLDRCVKENGCLQIIPGSNKFGRIDHGFIGGQQGACEQRMQDILEHYQPVNVEMEPGDALFFHSNVLHKSDQNKSDMRRWAFLTVYNAKSNSPVVKDEFPSYTPIQKVNNNAIRTCKNLTDFSGKNFLDPKKDHTVKVK